MTLEQQLAEQAKRGLLGLGLEQETAEEYAPWASLLAQFIPGVGEGVGIDNTVNAINDERYGDAAIEGGLTLLGAVPVVGDMAAAAIKGIRKAPVKAFDEAAWLKDNPRPEGLSTENAVQAWQQRLQRARRSDAEKELDRIKNKEAARERRAKNGEAINSRRRERYDARRDEINAARREADAKKRPEKTLSPEEEEFLKQNPHPFPEMGERALTASEKRNLNAWYMKKSRAMNPAKTRARYRAEAANKKSALLKRTAPWAKEEKIDEIYRTAAEVSAETGIPHHVDHVIPLRGKKVSGLHHQDNLLVVPGAENLSKNNKFEPGDLPPRAGVRKSRAYLKKIREAKEKAKR